MPDDAKPEKPIDLDLDFDPPAARPAAPPAKPIDLDWFEPPAGSPAAPPPAVDLLPLAAPVAAPVAAPIATPVAVPAVPVVQKRPPVAVPAVPARVMQANPSPEFRKEAPVRKHTLLASVVVLGLMLGTALAVLVLMYATYAGFKLVGKPRPDPAAAATKR